MMISGRFVVYGTLVAMSVASCSGGGGGGSVTPNPMATETSAPSVLVVMPATADVNGLGATFATQMTVSETHYASAFTETDTCHPGSGTIATISPPLGSPSGGALTATITGVANGTCSVTWHDATGQATTSTIYVTTSAFTAQ